MTISKISDEPKLLIETTANGSLVILYQQDALDDALTHRVMLEPWEAREVATRLNAFADAA